MITDAFLMKVADFVKSGKQLELMTVITKGSEA